MRNSLLVCLVAFAACAKPINRESSESPEELRVLPGGNGAEAVILIAHQLFPDLIAREPGPFDMQVDADTVMHGVVTDGSLIVTIEFRSRMQVFDGSFEFGEEPGGLRFRGGGALLNALTGTATILEFESP